MESFADAAFFFAVRDEKDRRLLLPKSAKARRLARMIIDSGFDPAGCFIRGFDHESAMSPWTSDPPKIWPGVLEHVPEQFSPSLTEPAFHMDDTTFCIWFSADAQGWRQGEIAYPAASDPDGASWMLSYYLGGPQTYHDFAEHYYEVDVPVEAIARVYKHEPLSPALIQALGSQRRYDQLVAEAATIGYPIVRQSRPYFRLCNAAASVG